MICTGKSKGDLMPNVIPRHEGPAFVWADETDYAAGTAVGGTRTDDLDLTALAAGAARQGVKVDLGEKRARQYAVTLSVEFVNGDFPDASETIDLYWGPSLSFTAGTGNTGGLAGTDAAYTGYAASSLERGLEQLQKIGSLHLSSDDDPLPQLETFIFEPMLRYGQPVVVNRCDTEVLNSAGNADLMYIRMAPLFDSV